jgi:lipopolysaccharide transport system permease protein
MSNNFHKEIIKPQRSLLDIRFHEIWSYRDLLFTFVRRDYAASYKQTILGPLWHIIQPVLPVIMYTFVFGTVAKISTDGIPKPLFYLSGLLLWNYFVDCFSRTSTVFTTNAGIFGKVYFPRLVMPLAAVISSLMRFGSQSILFLILWIYFLTTNKSLLTPHSQIILLPVLILFMAGFALGLGLIVASLSARYRDLAVVVGFFVNLLQYATCVIYPLSAVPAQYRFAVQLNPLTSVLETFRYAFLGHGHFSWYGLVYSFACMLLLIFIGVIYFNKVQNTYIDTV